MIQAGFFDFGDRLKNISKFGDPLEWLSVVVNFEVFRKDLEEALSFSDQGKGDRPAGGKIPVFGLLKRGGASIQKSFLMLLRPH